MATYITRDSREMVYWAGNKGDSNADFFIVFIQHCHLIKLQFDTHKQESTAKLV